MTDKDCCVCGNVCNISTSDIHKRAALTRIFGKELSDLGRRDSAWLDSLLKAGDQADAVQSENPENLCSTPSSGRSMVVANLETPVLHYRSHDLNFLNSPSPFPERLISDVRRQSTPRALAASLGADSDSSEWSWSSSMATPPGPCNNADLADEYVHVMSAEPSLDMVECAKYTGPARVLFSPGLALLQDSSLLIRTLPSDITLRSTPPRPASDTGGDASPRGSRSDLAMFDDATLVDDVRSRSDSEEYPSIESSGEYPCTESAGEYPCIESSGEYPCTEPFEPLDTGGDWRTSVEKKSSQVLREILAESGFGEVSRFDESGAADVVVWMESAGMDSRPLVEMEGANEDSRPVMEVVGAEEDSRRVVEIEGAEEASRPVAEIEGAKEDSRPVVEMEGANEDSRPVMETEGAQTEPDTLELFFGSPPPEARRAAPKRKRKRDSVTRSCDDAVTTETGSPKLVVTRPFVVVVETPWDDGKDAVTAVTTTPDAKDAFTVARTPTATTPESNGAELDDPFSPLSPNVAAAMVTPPDLKRRGVGDMNAVATDTVANDLKTTPKLGRTNLEMFTPISPRTLAALSTTPSSSDVSMDTTFTQVSPDTLAAMVREAEKTSRSDSLNRPSLSSSGTWRSNASSPASRDTSGYVSASLSSLTTPTRPSSNAQPVPTARSDAQAAPTCHSDAKPVPTGRSDAKTVPSSHSNAHSRSATPLSEADASELTSSASSRVESGNGLNRRRRKFAYPPSVKQGSITTGQPKRLFALQAVDQTRRDVSRRPVLSRDIDQSTDRTGSVRAPTAERSADSVSASIGKEINGRQRGDGTEAPGVGTPNLFLTLPPAVDDFRKEAPSGSTGFSSAAGRRIAIGDDALSKARALLTDVEENYGVVKRQYEEFERQDETVARSKEPSLGSLGSSQQNIEEASNVNRGLDSCSELSPRSKEATRIRSELEVCFTDSNKGLPTVIIDSVGISDNVLTKGSDIMKPVDRSPVVPVKSYHANTAEFEDGGSLISVSGRRINASGFEKSNNIFSDAEIDLNFDEEGPEKLMSKLPAGMNDQPSSFLAALPSSNKVPPDGVTVVSPPSFYDETLGERRESSRSVQLSGGVKARQQDRDLVVNTSNSRSTPTVVPSVSVPTVVPSVSVPVTGFGFKTAGGKGLKISDESLKKASLILESVLSQSQTGSDAKLELGNDLSEELTARNVGAETEHDRTTGPIGQQGPSSASFSTASGKDINISEPALEKMKKMFEAELEMGKELPDQNWNVETRKKTDTDGTKVGAVCRIEDADHPDWDITNTQMIRACSEFENESESGEMEAEPVESDGSKAGAPVVSSENATASRASWGKRLLTNTQILDASDDNLIGENIMSERVRNCGSTKTNEVQQQQQQIDGLDSLSRERERSVGESCDFFEGMDDSGFTQEILETTTVPFQLTRSSTQFQQDSETKHVIEEVGDGTNEAEEMEVTLVLDDEVAFEKSQERFRGFRTASGYQVTVSEEALVKVRERFVEHRGPIAEEHDVISREGISRGGPIAEEREVISRDGVGHDGPIAEERDVIPCQKIGTKTETTSESFKFAGFSSASGKTVVTSETALRAVRGIFNPNPSTVDPNIADVPRYSEIQNENDSRKRKGSGRVSDAHSKMDPRITKAASSWRSTVSEFRGFATASGKTVQVSDLALNEVRGFFDEKERRIESKSSEVPDITEHDRSDIGGKCIGVSEVVEPNDDGRKRKFDVSSEIGRTGGFGGFSTAAGKRVRVSEEALLKVRGLGMMDDSGSHGNTDEYAIDDAARPATPGGDNEDGVDVTASPAFSGFCTAGGRKVDVTDEALARVRHSEAPPGGGSTNSADSRSTVVNDSSTFNDLGVMLKVSSRNSKDIELSNSSRKIRGMTDQGAEALEHPDDVEQFRTPFKTARGDSVTPTRGRGPPTDARLGPGGDANSERPDNESEIGLSDPETRARLSQARFCQEQVIRKKRRQKIKPSVGGLLRTKIEGGRVSTLAEFAEEEEGRVEVEPLRKALSPVAERALGVTPLNMEDYQFKALEHYSSDALRENVEVCLDDGAVLVFSDRWTAGKSEFAGALLAMPHVDPALVCDRWVFNHYGLIVWKLASLERKFPCRAAVRFLTPSNVMLQLKYRYDREIDKSERSCIRKIYEHDDTANKRMVLCVTRLETNPGQSGCTGGDGGRASRGTGRTNGTTGSRKQTYCRLTDGWYSIGAILDPAMESLVAKRKVFVGQKLCLSGAELTSQEACSPLDAPDHVMLKIHTNSSRPCRWDAKLGYQADPRALCVPLSSLYADGGLVGCADVVILRRYPTQYRERMPDGSSVVRSGREEDKWNRNFTKNSEKRMEELYSELQKKYELQESRKSKVASEVGRMTRTQLEALDCGEEIYDAVVRAADPATVETYLSSEQRRLLEDYRTNLIQAGHARLHEELQQLILDDKENVVTSRKVSPFVRFRVGGYSTRDVDRQSTMILNVYQVDDDVLKVLQEGKRVKIFAATPVQARGQPTGDLHLHTSRATRFLPLPADDNKLDLVYEPRDLLTGSDVRHRPAYGEIDTVGLVVKVEPDNQSYANKRQIGFPTVYLADRHRQFLAVKFWGGLRSFHVGDVVNVGDVVTVGNLSWRPNGSRYRPGHVTSVFVTETTSFSTKMPDAASASYRSSYQALRKLNTPEFLEQCGNSLLEYLTQPRTPSCTPSSWTIPTAARDVTPMRADDVTPVRNAVSCPGRPAMERKQALQRAKARRLEYLEGSAPPMTPMPSISASQSVRKHFKSPFMTSQDSPPMDLVSSQEDMTSRRTVTSHIRSTNRETVRKGTENISEPFQPPAPNVDNHNDNDDINNNHKSLGTSQNVETMASATAVTSSTPACRPRARASGLSATRRRTVRTGEPAVAGTQSKRSAKKRETFRTPSKENETAAPRKLTYGTAGENARSSVETDDSRERADSNTTPSTLGNVVTEIKVRKRKRGPVSKETVAVETVANVHKRQRRSSRLSRN